jgi:hypothetical protein
MNQEIKPYIEYFRDIFYISLPHEVRATISSIEIFLISLFTKDIEWLDKKNNFDPDKSNLEFIRLQWNVLNIDNKNVSQIKRIK